MRFDEKLKIHIADPDLFGVEALLLVVWCGVV